MEDRINFPGNLYDCHNEMTWDSLKTENALIGEWEWIFIHCYSDWGNGNDYSHRGLTMEIKSDHTLIIKENRQFIKTSTWTIKETGGWFNLDEDPSVLQLHGVLTICEDLISFNASSADGCDNYFRRID